MPGSSTKAGFRVEQCRAGLGTQRTSIVTGKMPVLPLFLRFASLGTVETCTKEGGSWLGPFCLFESKHIWAWLDWMWFVWFGMWCLAGIQSLLNHYCRLVQTGDVRLENIVGLQGRENISPGGGYMCERTEPSKHSFGSLKVRRHLVLTWLQREI